MDQDIKTGLDLPKGGLAKGAHPFGDHQVQENYRKETEKVRGILMIGHSLPIEDPGGAVLSIDRRVEGDHLNPKKEILVRWSKMIIMIGPALPKGD